MLIPQCTLVKLELHCILGLHFPLCFSYTVDLRKEFLCILLKLDSCPLCNTTVPASEQCGISDTLLLTSDGDNINTATTHVTYLNINIFHVFLGGDLF